MDDAFRNGEWQLCERTGWPDNASFRKLLAWCWQGKDARYIVVVNLSDAQSQANIHLSWEDPRGRGWHLEDQLSAQVFERQGLDARGTGLFVDLPPWGSHLLRAQPA